MTWHDKLKNVTPTKSPQSRKRKKLPERLSPRLIEMPLPSWHDKLKQQTEPER